MKKLLALAFLLATAATVFSQQTRPTPEPPVGDVVRVNTELVQTDVMVFDRQGKFVDNLTRDQFELKVDGKPQEVSFFDLVRAGSSTEEAQLAAARGMARSTNSSDAITPLDTGRAVFFIIDDLHLSRQSLERTRNLLLHFIDQEMGQNDQAAILSTSGEIGLLQQLTSDKTVLRAAVGRLKFRSERDVDVDAGASMSEYQAFNIIEREDYATLNYFAATLEREYYTSHAAAVMMTMSRARNILQRSSVLNSASLSALENFARSTSQLAGRKLAFFVSDGFSITHTETDGATEKMRHIVEAAARAGLVIYTLDARGLMTGTAGSESALIRDETNHQARVSVGEIAGSQESLRTLAEETGGRALLNTNALGNSLTKVLNETSSYYLLAWRPEPNSWRPGNRAHHVEVSVKGKPELSVRLRRNIYNQEVITNAASSSNSNSQSNSNARATHAATPENELVAALRSFYPRKSLPTSVAAGFIDLPGSGLSLTTAVQIDTRTLNFDSLSEGQKAIVDVAVAVFDGQDRYVSGYKQQLAIQPRSTNATAPRSALLSRQFTVTPGLYQVRVATRDAQTGRTGSAVEWVEIPDLSQNHLALSTLFLGEPVNGASENSDDEISAARLKPDRRFAPTSQLRFVTYIYNAAHQNAPPDLVLQVQIFRGDQPVVTTTLRKVTINPNTDIARIPYAAEIPLAGLPIGHYALQVTVIDRTARSSATQRINFVVE